MKVEGLNILFMEILIKMHQLLSIFMAREWKLFLRNDFMRILVMNYK